MISPVPGSAKKFPLDLDLDAIALLSFGLVGVFLLHQCCLLYYLLSRTSEVCYDDSETKVQSHKLPIDSIESCVRKLTHC